MTITAVRTTEQRSPQSLWLNPLSRRMLISGTLQLLMDEGVTGACYEQGNLPLAERAPQHRRNVAGLLWRNADDIAIARRNVTARAVVDAADLFRPIFERSCGRDGFVCVDVCGHGPFAEGRHILEEAVALWRAIARPNVLIGLPGTPAHLPLMGRLIAEGVNINVTQLCSSADYRGASEAWLAGLEARLATKAPVDRIAAIATVPVTRIDQALDAALHGKAAPGSAIACAAQILRDAGAVAASSRFRTLARQGAQPMRLHWALAPGGGAGRQAITYLGALAGTGAVCSMPAAAILSRTRGSAPAPQRVAVFQGYSRTEHGDDCQSGIYAEALVEGAMSRLRGVAPSRRAMVGADDYAAGFRRGYFERSDRSSPL